MSFAQVGDDLKNDSFLFLQNKVKETFEGNIDYATVILYALTQYFLNRGLKELG